MEECHEKGKKLNWLPRILKIQAIKNDEEREEALNYLDLEVTEVFTSSAERRKRKPKPPGLTKLNEARLQHVLCRISFKGQKKLLWQTE